MTSENLENVNSAGPEGIASVPELFSGTALVRASGVDEQLFPKAALYIVGLPIGNAADITVRALWILSVADAVACEDTRETRKLLERYGIRARTISVHEHNEAKASETLIRELEKGARIALVTDAGTPAVSDPGAKAVAAVREAGFRVIPVPGCSAVITALSAAGLNAYRFTFAGFVAPQAKQRHADLAVLCGRGEAFVLYEAPHRVKELLTDLATLLEPERTVVVGREVTKRFETFERVKASEIPAWLTTHEARGVYVICVDEAERRDAVLTDDVMKWARAAAAELPLSRAAALAAKVSGVKRDLIYKALLAESGKAED